MPPQILIAGIGNIFLGDDAFGPTVVTRLSEFDWPDHVQVADFGIRGMDLAYALMDCCDAAILIDAVARGSRPGTLYVIEPTDSEGIELITPNAHSMDPATVLQWVRQLGGEPPYLRLVGCEPQSLEPRTNGTLTAPVAAAIDEALKMVKTLVTELSSSLVCECTS